MYKLNIYTYEITILDYDSNYYKFTRKNLVAFIYILLLSYT